MNSTVVVLTVLVAALGIAYIIGRLLTVRAGLMKEVTPAEPSAETDNSDLGLSTTGPTVVHFSATWCGPCAAVRRVVDQVCDDLEVAHVEIDLDANPVAARRLSVLSCRRRSSSTPRGSSGTAPRASRNPLILRDGPATAVGLSTPSLGKLSAVLSPRELLLTKRRAVDLCRVAGCCCCCSC
jgi:Thioredoxin.